MERPVVSVMMPAHNAERYVRAAIESVLAQTYANFELIVVNDGSTDRTRDIVASFSDPRIRLFDKPNGGESSARNVALRQSRGEFVAFLDADDLHLPQHLAVTIDFLTAHPARDAVYTDGLHINEHDERLATLQSRRRGPFEGYLYEQVVRASDVFGPPSCVVLRRELVERHRLRFNERIVIGPDWDFFTRFSAVAAFGYLNAQTCLYRVHNANITSQVNSARRRGYLAMCRENAIRTDRFGTCSAETRAEVFYDLLVNLLSGEVARQCAVMEWPAFKELPESEQARLLRLTAVEVLLHDRHSPSAVEWLDRARALNPGDLKATVLAALHSLSPRVCWAALRLVRSPVRESQPFADLMQAVAPGGSIHPARTS